MPSLPPVTTPTPLTWVFAGDSITQGVEHTHGARCWVEHVHERLRYQLGRVFDVVINTGIAGWTAPDVLQHHEHLLTRFAPDVASIALGMNDAAAGPAGRARFERALRELGTRALDGGAAVVLHTPNTVGREALPFQGEVAAYADIVRAVATDLGVPVADHHAHWRGRFGDGPATSWLDEAIHPNAEGHRQMAAVALDALGLGPLVGDDDW